MAEGCLPIAHCQESISVTIFASTAWRTPGCLVPYLPLIGLIGTEKSCPMIQNDSPDKLKLDWLTDTTPLKVDKLFEKIDERLRAWRGDAHFDVVNHIHDAL